MGVKSKQKKLLPRTDGQTEVAPDTGGEGWRVLLFNDDIHTVDEVTLQLTIALHCSRSHAEEIMLKAHHTGSAVVIIAARSRAERVASVLRDIALHVRVDHV